VRSSCTGWAAPERVAGAEDAFLQRVAVEPLVNVGLLGFEVDFHWPDRRLVIEVDGGHHALQAAIDDGRDDVLRDAGWTVLRFSDREVYEQSRRLRAALETHRLSHPR
jgi:very-short-patch-repair endonuclease